jgi:hypothetical protein
MHRVLLSGVIAVGFAVLPARAQDAAPPNPSSEQPSGPAPRSEQDRAKLEADIARDLGVTQSAAEPSPAVSAPSAQSPVPASTTGGSPFARILLLPDISAVGSGALSWNDYDIATRSPREGPWSDPRRVTPVFEELEVGLQAVVDPYARADVFIAFSDEGAEIEEAYLSALTLPGGIVARAGKLFAPFGRINTQHPHTWELVDRPLAWQRLLALEALGGPGLDVAWLAPLPWFAELHLAYQSLEPAPVSFAEDVEEPDAARAGTARLVNFIDLSDRLTLGAGASGALVEDGDGWRDLAGADVYLKYRPGASRAYLAVQAELIWRRLRDLEAAAGSDWGAYAQTVYNVSRRWAFGGRWERAPGVVDGSLTGAEQRWSGLVSLAPSEFQRLRLQGGWARLPGGGDGLEALLAVEFAIGAHGAHPF